MFSLAHENAEKIDALAQRVQSLPPELRWWLAREGLAARATGVSPVYGPNERRLRRVLSFFDRVGLGWAAAQLVVLGVALGIWSRQAYRPRPQAPAALFMGILALREADALPIFAQMTESTPVMIDSRQALCTKSFGRPDLMTVIGAFRDTSRPIDEALDTVDLFGRLDLLADYAMRGGRYSLLLAAFRDLAAHQGLAVPIASTTAGLAAFAATRAGFEVVYFPHGFLRRSLVFPDFRAVVGINAIECRHVLNRLGGRPDISVLPHKQETVVPTRCLAVVGDYGDHDPVPLRTLLELARAYGYQIAIRPHPVGNPAFFAEWRGQTDIVIDEQGNLESFMRRHRPSVMATWFSTTILDAVVLGVVPVTLSETVADIVFPHREVALVWPEHRDRVVGVLSDEGAREAALTRARRMALASP